MSSGRSSAQGLAPQAVRLQRVQWAWAILLAAIGSLYLTPLRSSAFTHPLLSAVPYLACGALLASGLQPAHLAIVSVIWGVSAIMLLPPVSAAFGTDPLAVLLGTGLPATIAVAGIRVALAAIAWRQFLAHRSLVRAAHDGETAPAVVGNLTDRMAEWSGMLGFFSLMAPIFALGMRGVGGGAFVLQVGLILATFALGTGLGAAFSPTLRRASAVRGILLGTLGGMLTLIVGAAPRGIPSL